MPSSKRLLTNPMYIPSWFQASQVFATEPLKGSVQNRRAPVLPDALHCAIPGWRLSRGLPTAHEVDHHGSNDGDDGHYQGDPGDDSTARGSRRTLSTLRASRTRFTRRASRAFGASRAFSTGGAGGGPLPPPTTRG